MLGARTIPARSAAPITPDDATDIAATRKGLLVANAGALTVITEDGGTVTIAAPVGYIPLVVTRVFATDTTASGITALR